MDKSYRIHTNISSDTCLNVNMQQDFDFLEVLSLKLKQKDAYRLHSSNYGVIVGRVLANDAFGIPNAKVSVFIEKTDGDSVDMETIYPYKEVTTKDKDGRRYNILPDYSDDECYRVVGTFPNKRLVLDDDVQLEVYDKYWKYSTVTNNAGDFMLFAVPTGSVTVHIEMDLSDIGVLSQKPRDFEYKGYNLTLFDSPSQFKESTNLDDLAQIFSQNKSIFVYPFWGDADNGVACITRSDVQIQYKFEPTCVFMGSIVSDNEGNSIGHSCAPEIDNGMNSQLIGGNGTIEMIRKTTDGLVEEYSIQGNQLIDENGVWCYQIPMNLDYIGTDEYGNIVPTDNPNKGIPTRTQVRFRISKNETGEEGFSRHTAKYLVPMNPRLNESEVIPTLPDKGSDIENMYTFGSATPISCFRDLYWNNVYSVKNYIPKVQVAHRAHAKNYSALKGSNLVDNQNPIPFNKLRIDIPFLYMVVCILYTIMIWVVTVINAIISLLHFLAYELCIKIPVINKKICPFGPLKKFFGDLSCITMSAGSDEGNVAYYPGCSKAAMKDSSCPEDMEEEGCIKKRERDELLDKIQRNLAKEFKIVKLDLYQDWINGCLYMPLWYWRKRKKKTFLFFTLSRAKNDYCSSNGKYSRLKTYVTCNIRYYDNSLTVRDNRDSMPDDEKRWHKNKKNSVRFVRGLIKPVENKDGLTAYYYAAVQPTTENTNMEKEMEHLPRNIRAIRLYATDIILLGNLDPNNIYGIPQFFKCLPSTTANIPPIATIEEQILDSNQKEIENDLRGSEDSGNTLTTGMDWNHDGGSRSPKYKTGLFMDLACTYANTKPKSCINVERLSEFGVSLDLRHKIAYHENGTDTQYGDIDTDGFISKYELDDMENRAMFATLNHIGFIPQEHQDMVGDYTTQVPDINTSYLVPKFKYIYPVDFDGRLQLPMDLYKNNFKQAMFDERDESYLTFRFGAENGRQATQNSEERIRHFYHTNLLDMPLYNNSYYFYFGVNKGKTAIDKFNELFYAPCFQNNKKPFSLVITAQGRSYCPEVYNGDCDAVRNQDKCNVPGNTIYSSGNNKNNAYGYIRVESDDIRTPYSYTLYDSLDRVVISETGMTLNKFVIGGDIDGNDDTVCNCDGHIRYQNKPCDLLTGINPYETSGLTNQEYVLEITDADGKTLTEKIKVEVQKIRVDYEAKKLGTKYYNSASTRIDYICHDNNGFYGEIRIKKLIVDGYTCELTNASFIIYDNEKDVYKFCITGKSADISDNVQAILELRSYSENEENKMKNCLCENNDDGTINEIKAAQDNESTVVMKIDAANRRHYVLGFDDETKIATIYVYQPNRYQLKVIQGCKTCANPVESNYSTNIVDVLNGEPFLTTLNTMPTKFMLGTVNDNNNADIARTSYFYNNVAAVEPVKYGDNTVADKNKNGSYHLKGWYGTHQEDSYMFSRRNENKTYRVNQSVWEDMFSSTKDDISTPKMKRYILKFKFDKMFALSNGAYMTDSSSSRFIFEATGGVNPILYRDAYPLYKDVQRYRTQYIVEDSNTVSCIENAPNIVGENFSLPYENRNGYTPGFELKGPKFNNVYSEPTLLGNYFAAFTRNGGYKMPSNYTLDSNIMIERSPSFASVSPLPFLKVIGSDVITNMGKISTGNLRWVHTKQEGQQLTGDIPRTTLPYVRALYVDRRFDYDLTILAPVVGNNFSLYTDANRNRVWKGGRISGWTYNGIEMSYDESHSIISANTESAYTISYIPTGDEPGVSEIVYTAATFNKRLEYTYKYDCADLCMTCGHQEKNMGDICPHCKGDNIKRFHGEIGALKDEVDTVYTQDGSDVLVPKQSIREHQKDTINFWDGKIPQVILGDNEKNYTLDDAITYYHKSYGDEKFDWVLEDNNERFAPRWGKWNQVESSGVTFGFNPNKDKNDPNYPLFKEFYSSRFANYDIRHLYWSLFNWYRLKWYTESNDKYIDNTTGIKYYQQQGNESGYGISAINNPLNPFYVYHYPALDKFFSANTTYNGDFNREDSVNKTEYNVGKLSYPTRRYLDIGNLPSISYYQYTVEGCSYGVKAQITDDGRITAETDADEKVEIGFLWTPPITVVPPTDGSSSYHNVSYVQRGSSTEPGEEYKKFQAAEASIRFKYNPVTVNDNFDIYTKSPRLIQVLPYIKDRNIDGIGFYKTANPSQTYDGTEFGGSYGDGYSLKHAIEKITLSGGTFTNPTTRVWDFTHGFPTYEERVNMVLPENVHTATDFKTKYGLDVDMTGNVFFKKNDEFLTSDDNDFTNIEFRKDEMSLYNNHTNQNVTVFTVLVDREYVYYDDDNLVRHIRTLETSDLYDCRDILMKVTTTSADTPISYVEMRRDGVSGISGVNESSTSYGNKDIEVDVKDSEGGQSSGNISVPTTTNNDTELGEDTTKIFTQVLTFDMAFDTYSGTPVDQRQNESFADYSMMTYKFKFQSLNNDIYEIIPEKELIQLNDRWSILRFTVRWTTNMGIAVDPQWVGQNLDKPIKARLYVTASQSGFVYLLNTFHLKVSSQQTEGGYYSGGPGKDVEADCKALMQQGTKYLTNISIN